MTQDCYETINNLFFGPPVVCPNLMKPSSSGVKTYSTFEFNPTNANYKKIDSIHNIDCQNVSEILKIKKINDNVWFLVQFENSEVAFLSKELADKFISDEKMINFLIKEIEKNPYNPIPTYTSKTIPHRPEMSEFVSYNDNPYAGLLKMKEKITLTDESDFNGQTETETETEIDKEKSHQNETEKINENQNEAKPKENPNSNSTQKLNSHPNSHSINKETEPQSSIKRQINTDNMNNPTSIGTRSSSQNHDKSSESSKSSSRRRKRKSLKW
ncbi:hypothetical protein TRFO_10147 [Tritrichomonas foetus]|uniref:Uncharacterized protein n=1 Tax=Tritrichomonas foetus TaxID=1144522 RepID=A0A1J4JAK4_9EUKA|nr:hypothetical protein TRFO_10147 [Tritrichomonas foetus]|eukprot:OHS96202.1 hypothetical protein TRFO_10147 [Tritrichomonas foetus]